MTLVRWTPFRELRDMPREMTRLFGRPFSSFFEEPLIMETMPPIDIFSRGKDLVARLELPGVDVKDVDISLSDHTLYISGERREETEINEEDYYRRERSYGSFERSLPVPDKVTERDIDAVYEDGILTLTVKGAAEVGQAKHIEVKSPKATRKEVRPRKKG
jgi:HSP20 family protein